MDMIFRRDLSIEGIDLLAKHADIKEHVVFPSSLGGDIAVPHTGSGGLRLGWHFGASPGSYDLWAQFAAESSSPVVIEINGMVVLDQALGQITFGKKPVHQTWVYQGRVKLQDGASELLLRSDLTMPYVRALKLAPSGGDAPSSLALVPRPARPIAREQLAALVRNLVLGLRPLLARGVNTDELSHVLLATLRAIRADLDEPQARQGFRGPLNGQIIRQMIFTSLDKLLGFDAFVETGAYLGTTTEMFATYERPVFSCESNEQFFYRAATRLAPFQNVTLTLEDSREFLRKFCASHAGTFSIPFVYLDAHWNDDLPLPEEIELVADAFARFVIMVDDFKHPQFGYGYDKYANAIELTLDYLEPKLPSRERLSFMFPVHPEHLETGARRGTLIIAPHAVAHEILMSEVPVAKWD